MKSYKVISNNVERKFNESIKLTECSYKEHLLSDEDDQLIKIGPMNKQEALSFFNQFYMDTIPLYMLEINNDYYAYY